MVANSRQELIDEEAFLIEHSGEIPEVALYSSIHYLTADPEGPGLELRDEEIKALHQAVMKRYLFIILRDLTPKNRDKRIYRGVERAIINWRRMRTFADKHGYRVEQAARKVKEAAERFMEKELDDVRTGRRKSCLNCSIQDLEWFFAELDISNQTLLREIGKVCYLK